MSFHFKANGSRGLDAAAAPPGRPGASRLMPSCGGSDGEDGFNAGPAVGGEPGGSVVVWLSSGVDAVSSMGAAGGSAVVRVQACCSGGPLTAPSVVDQTVAVEAFQVLDCEAVGGDGGHGGRGGDGGPGGRGGNGLPATRWTPGTDGGPGGDGGRGGMGSHGAPGGQGGVVEIKLHEQDAYLLMSVATARTPEVRIVGGCAGVRGRHGRGGCGGRGGMGGPAGRERADKNISEWFQSSYRAVAHQF